MILIRNVVLCAIVSLLSIVLCDECKQDFSGFSVGWIGNNSTSSSDQDGWTQIGMPGMFVDPSGRVYGNVPWDECGPFGCREVGVYQNGQFIGRASDTHGWARLGGNAIVTDDTYIYQGMIQGPGEPGWSKGYPPAGTSWNCVRRIHNGQPNYSPAPFPGGNGYDGSMLIVNVNGSTQVSGLALNGGELFVSDPSDNMIKVYKTSDFSLSRQWAFSNPGPLTFDKDNNLWAIQTSSSSVIKYSREGNHLGTVISSVVGPSALVVDNSNRLLIADTGSDNQIKIFANLSNPYLVDTFGVKGGIFSGVAGQFGDLRFNAITGVGVDAQNNIYVASSPGTILESYTPSGHLNWRLFGLLFVDEADRDIQNENILYTKDHIFNYNYNGPNAGGQSWDYIGTTLNPTKYPEDFRYKQITFVNGAMVRYVNGHKLMFCNDMYSDGILIYRWNHQTDGLIAIPSGVFLKPVTKVNGQVWPVNQPGTPNWYWRDANGNGKVEKDEVGNYNLLPGVDYNSNWGWWVDSDGNIWIASESKGIVKIPLTDFDSFGNPVYGIEKQMLWNQFLPLFSTIERLEYHSDIDTMFIGGFQPKTVPVSWGLVGDVVLGFTNWSTTPRLAYTVPISIDKNNMPKTMSIAGDYLFIGYVQPGFAFIYDLKSALQVCCTLVCPAQTWLDFPLSLKAFRRAQGEYVVLMEQDGNGSKVNVYQLKT